MAEWITGQKGKWHLAKRETHIGRCSGQVFRRYVVAACSGKQVGRPCGWGSTVAAEPGKDVCIRCARLAAAQKPTVAQKQTAVAQKPSSYDVSMYKALQVIVLTPHILDYLVKNDPKALEQAKNAIKQAAKKFKNDNKNDDTQTPTSSGG